MMNFLLVLLFCFPVFACDLMGQEKNPVLMKKLTDYDKFVMDLQNEKDSFKAINQRIKTEGILLEALINPKLVKNYPSSFADESIVGARKLFLKNLKLPPGLSNDIVYEVATPKSNKTIRSWQIPSNESFLGIRGNELFIRTYLGSPCVKIKRDVMLAISPNGSFRAVPDVKFAEPKLLEIEKCPAAKAIFKTSAYDSCMELKDVKSKKKRIIVFQSPVT